MTDHEPASASPELVLVAMEPTTDRYRTNDPASWSDRLRCVEATVEAEIPRSPRPPG